MTSIDDAGMGKRIKQRRLELGISQSQLAQRVTAAKLARDGAAGDTTASRVSRWENGHETPTTLVGELCSALDVTTSWLLYGYNEAAQEASVDLSQVRRLFTDQELAHVDRDTIVLMARLLERSKAGPAEAKAALMLLFPRAAGR